MIRLNLNGGTAGALQVLCLVAHSDDIEIGCGGTILRLVEEYPCSVIHWVVFSAMGERETEAQRDVALFAGKSRLRGPLLKRFPDGFLPFVGADVKAVFEELKQTVPPDLILSPQPQGRASRSSLCGGTHLEYLPRPFHPGVRDSKIRRRHGLTRPLRAARKGDLPAES
jgi:hypothetical protein